MPTLEELASLLEPEKKDGLYIDPLFDRKQKYCWTSDHQGGWSGPAFVVFFFGDGSVYLGSLGNLSSVRCVFRDND